jgi:hypothetical protein
MTDEKIINIYEQSQHIKKCADIFQACIHIAGCYGLKEEWAKLRKLYFQPHTYGVMYHFIAIYQNMCGKIFNTFGYRAWYHTLTFSFD